MRGQEIFRIRHEKFGRADMQAWWNFSSCSTLPSLPPRHVPSQTQILDDAERDLGAVGSAPGEVKAPPACSCGVISGSAPWLFLHGLVTTRVGASSCETCSPRAKVSW